MSNYFFKKRVPAVPAGIICFVIASVLMLLVGCQKEPVSMPTIGSDLVRHDSLATGEGFLLSVLDEIETINAFAQQEPGFSAQACPLNRVASALPSYPQKHMLSVSAADTAYIYGEMTDSGYAAVVTERHTYPKGLLLITVRRSHGLSSNAIVTETKRYISFSDFANDSPQQSNITEVYGLSSDTIVTHVLRNGILETYTFRLPVVTRVVNPNDGSVRVTTRHGVNGMVESEVRDGNNILIQLRRTYGQSDGAIITYTQFADSSWRNVRVVGRADGSVFREITSGF